MAWHHYRAEGRRWPLYWFSINAVLFCFAMLALAFTLLDEERWFVGLSIVIAILAAWYARHTCDSNVSKLWRFALAGTMIGWWAYMSMLVYWPEGDTNICYDRIHQSHPWGPLVNLGPDPNCNGISQSGRD